MIQYLANNASLPEGSPVTDIDTFFSSIPDRKPVRLFLPTIGADDRTLIQCVFQKSKTNRFNLLFKPNTLPVQQIDKDTTCLINLDIAGQSVSIESNIVNVVNDQTLEMIPQKAISHEQMREYFRVDCAIPIILKSTIPEGFGEPEDEWKIMGITVDLSGSGLRASFKTAPPENTQVRIELALPSANPTIISAIASPVRITQLTDKLWDAAYHIDDIDDDDRDKIIGCCLVAQRRMLRLKVQVKNS